MASESTPSASSRSAAERNIFTTFVGFVIGEENPGFCFELADALIGSFVCVVGFASSPQR